MQKWFICASVAAGSARRAASKSGSPVTAVPAVRVLAGAKSPCVRTAGLLGELDRRVRLTFAIPQAAATALAVIDGARKPLTPSQVSDRLLVPPATLTATLDLLERRGWIRRVAGPDDRRSTLIEITPDGRATADQLRPGIRVLKKTVLSALTPANGSSS